jgi:hypothetical protein
MCIRKGEKREPRSLPGKPIRDCSYWVYDGSPYRNFFLLELQYDRDWPAKADIAMAIASTVPSVAASTLMNARTPYWMKHSAASQTQLPGESSWRRATQYACDKGARASMSLLQHHLCFCCWWCCYYYHITIGCYNMRCNFALARPARSRYTELCCRQCGQCTLVRCILCQMERAIAATTV